MDPLISQFDAVKDDDLRLCLKRGIAYQADMSKRMPPGVNAEGQNYFNHYAAMEGRTIGRKIHAARVALVNRYVEPQTGVLDIGVGSGDFLKVRPNTFGYDVNPVAQNWLKQQSRWSDKFSVFEAFTFWDVLEHVENPERNYFRHMRDGTHLFTSLPVFEDLKRVRKSKHYKPGEHFYYFTRQGFIDWMAEYQWKLLECNDEESKAGRDGILSFAFVRSLPGYRDTLVQYQKMHMGTYGISGSMHLDTMAPYVFELNPLSILDYGCGRSDLVAHFWNDGKRKLGRYDPAIPDFKEMPEGLFDLVLCCDVMEHIRMADVQRVLDEIWQKSRNAIFTISLVPARAKLPDGRNAHVTLLSAKEWTRWIAGKFGNVERIQTGQDHLLMLKTF